VLDRLLAGDVDHGNRGPSVTCGPITACSPTTTPSTIAAWSHERSVLDDHRPSAGRLEHAPDPDSAREMDVGADLRTRADGGHVSTIVFGPTQAPMFT